MNQILMKFSQMMIASTIFSLSDYHYILNCTYKLCLTTFLLVNVYFHCHVSTNAFRVLEINIYCKIMCTQRNFPGLIV